MRLRLVVKRHTLPDTAVIWAVETAYDPTISQLLEQVNEVIPLESEGEWGLEDYAVEVRGAATNFECLHFQTVIAILHEDDEVVIRPLLRQDLKHRRQSGRHQITSDGKHLYDGFVFGRPRAKAPMDRPTISIPPRKRRRITYEAMNRDGEVEDETESLLELENETRIGLNVNDDRQLVIRANFEDDDDDDDERDFQPDLDDDDEDDEEDYQPDLDDNDNDEDEDVDEDDVSEDNILEPGTGEDNSNPEDSVNKESLSSLENLHSAFPSASVPVCRKILQNCEGDLGSSYDALMQGFQPKKSRSSVIAPGAALLPPSTKLTDGGSDNEKRTYATEDDAEHSSDEEINPLVNHYDQHGLPPGSISTGRGLSQMAEIVKAHAAKLPNISAGRPTSISSSKSVRFVEGTAVPKDVTIADQTLDDQSDDENFTGSDSDGSESSVLSEPSDDSSDSSSDSEASSAEQGPAEDISSTSGSDSDSNSDSDTDSDSSSDSDSDSEPEVVSSKVPTVKSTDVSGVVSIRSRSEKSNSTTGKDKSSVVPSVPPGTGKRSTKARNVRRRVSNILQRFKEKGVLPAGTTMNEFNQLDINLGTSPEAATEALAAIRVKENSKTTAVTTIKATMKATEFEARRQQLLASLESGGIEVGPETPPRVGKMAICNSNQPLNDTTNRQTVLDTSQSEAVLGRESLDPDTVMVDKTSSEMNKSLESTALEHAISSSEATPDSSTPGRRAKLDMGAGRRMLFGALGIKTPKNRADEAKVRSDLMKYVKPLKTVPTAAEVKSFAAVEDGDDPDAWRERITLRAVECCHEGFELSEPPFPFIQRWDPQQQSSKFHKGKRGGKGKKGQRNQPQYYDDESQVSSKRQKRKHGTSDTFLDSYDHDYYNEESAIDGLEDYYYDAEIDVGNAILPEPLRAYSDGIDGQVNSQPMIEVTAVAISQVDEDDLPTLPDDISALDDLTLGNVKAGMVIAFKQLIMSEATNWQPVMSPYRTAVVILATANGGLELKLAKRDREQSEKYYDEETGERIYGKFDMPDEDEDEDQEDDGFLDLTLAELSTPKIIQLPPDEFPAPEFSGEANLLKSSGDTDESTTPGYENTVDASIEASNIKSVEKPAQRYETKLNLVDEGDTDPLSVRGGISFTNKKADIFDADISDDARLETGCKSSVSSSVLRTRPSFPGTSQDSEDLDQLMKDMLENDDQSTIIPISEDINSSLLPPQAHGSISLDTSQPDDQWTAEGSSIVDIIIDLPTSQNKAFEYPFISLPSSAASQVTDNGHQPDFPTPGDSTLQKFDFDSIVNGDDKFSHEEQPELPSRNQLTNQNPTKPQPIPAQSSAGDLSSDPFPSLEDVISTAQTSKREKFSAQPLSDPLKVEESYNAAMAKLDADLDGFEDGPSQTTNKLSQRQLKVSPSQIKVSQTRPKSTYSKGNCSPFTLPAGSQQIDLTLSSDIDSEKEKAPDTEDGREYNGSFGLPKGPGRVKKQKPARRNTLLQKEPRKDSRRKTT